MRANGLLLHTHLISGRKKKNLSHSSILTANFKPLKLIKCSNCTASYTPLTWRKRFLGGGARGRVMKGSSAGKDRVGREWQRWTDAALMWPNWAQFNARDKLKIATLIPVMTGKRRWRKVVVSVCAFCMQTFGGVANTNLWFVDCTKHVLNTLSLWIMIWGDRDKNRCYQKIKEYIKEIFLNWSLEDWVHIWFIINELTLNKTKNVTVPK